jgi:putative polyketide hydroxylase
VTRTATYLGATDYQPLVNDFNIELGYLYQSRAMLPEAGAAPLGHDDPRKTCGRPGSRAPHIWVERDGACRSTLDLFVKSFVLLTGPKGAGWRQAAETAARELPGLPLESYSVGAELRDPDRLFCPAYGLAPDGACLVRPDGVVAWRSRTAAANPAAALTQALRAVLDR